MTDSKFIASSAAAFAFAVSFSLSPADAAPVSSASGAAAYETADKGGGNAGPSSGKSADTKRDNKKQTDAASDAAPPKTDDKKAKQHAEEIQFEYLDARGFKKRDINTYNIHYFQQARNYGALTVYRGLTLERALGYSFENDFPESSQAVGFGPALMLRWKQPLSGKLAASLDFSGSLLFYNHAHPANGRPFGFLWRLGPRLIWDYSERGSISVGWSVAHSSNGLRSKNPGYNGVGFSLGLAWRW